jgi:hypothetical protein
VRGPRRALRAYRSYPKLVQLLVPVVALALVAGVSVSATVTGGHPAAQPAGSAIAGTQAAATPKTGPGDVEDASASVEADSSVPSGTLTVTNTQPVAAGTNITFDYTASTANAENWIGIYQQGQTPGDVASTVWAYAPDASGTLTLSGADLTGGTWEAYLLYDDGYGIMAGPVAIQVSGDSLTLQNSGTTFPAGTVLTFAYSVTTADSTNWVGVYQQGQTPGDVASSVWAYAPDASGTVTLSTTGLAAGNYAAWLFYDNGYTELTAGISFTITGLTTLAISGPDSVIQGENISFSYTTTSPNPENWIGIYNHGDTDPYDYLTYVYNGGSSGTASINTQGLSPGTYDAYMLYDNGYDVMAGPVTFTVTAPPVVPQPVFKKVLTGFGSATLVSPSDVKLDSSGDVWVTDAGTDKVVEFSPQGAVIRSFGSEGSGDGQLNDPEALAVAGGDVYVADMGNNRVEEFTTTGQFVQTIGSSGSGDGQLDAPEGVAVDSAGDIWVADTGNNRLEEFSAAGAFITERQSDINDPQGLTFASNGDLWVADNGVADSGGDYAAQFDSGGNLIRYWGNSESADYAGMSNPADIALDAQGNFYVSLPDYDLIEEFNSAGYYEGEFGVPATDANGNLAPGGAFQALLYPEGIAANAVGDVFVADKGDHRIVEFVPQTPPKVTVEPSDTMVYAGYPALLHAEAAGEPRPTVQWESEAPGATSFAPIAGATSDTLVVRGTTTAESGTQYEAVFTNASGTATSDPATLTVNQPVAPPAPPDQPGGPGAPGMTSWPSSPGWGIYSVWPGVPAWPASPPGRPSAPAVP